ncbi:MAG: nucleoside triphosphate pyrophosphohydrolase [Formosa sp.]|jgi:XTP/dITP diphosphohydrolase|nr:nucleoside triphosphate pyrophosphohydrolase [Formosa sp.]|tara:strand:+ start:12390 stop:13175 length:786 start_codon:yes stop_codon:yes gene_type:complete
MTRREYQIQAFNRLLTIMDELRSKCPWDKKQTMESLMPLTIEETYELTDAILENDLKQIKGELGDLLLHIIFYSKIGSETNDFDIADVLNNVCDKLIIRHPHIYGDIEVRNEDDVKQNWEKIKLQEGNRSVLDGVPKTLPALVKAIRIQEKAAGVGFDWESTEQVFQKVEEELDEFKKEVDRKDQDKMEDEFGDVLFSIINYARFLKINPESALERTNKKFIKRFKYLERQVNLKKLSLLNMTIEEMNIIWEEAKSYRSSE